MRTWFLSALISVSAVFSLAQSASANVTPFSLPQMNANPRGTMYRMADHPNGVFVVEAYFLGCPYCNANAANVNALATEYANQPRVQVLDLGIDRTDAEYIEWIARHSPNHPVLKDATRAVVRQFGTTGYPSTYVINCRGEIAYEGVGGPWEDAEKQAIRAAINNLLAQNCTP